MHRQRGTPRLTTYGPVASQRRLPPVRTMGSQPHGAGPAARPRSPVVRVAAVELLVGIRPWPKHGVQWELGEELLTTIKRDRRERVRRVREALRILDKEEVKVDIVIFPLWTLWGRTLPAWLVKFSRGRTVVASAFTGSEGDWHEHAFVYQTGNSAQVGGLAISS